MDICVQLVEGKVSRSDIVARINRWEHGGQCFFFGAVREQNLGKLVTGISYDCYAPLTTKTLTEIAAEALNSFEPTGQVVLYHAFGHLHVGDTSVGIGVGTTHRKESFDTCRYIIEQLKKRAPIWKQEYYTDGKSGWIQGHSLCS